MAIGVVNTGQPGHREDGQDLGPMFRVEVNDLALNYDVMRMIRSVEFESAMDMADMFVLEIDNPGAVDDLFPDFVGYKAFQPGNEASLYVGYGDVSRPENFVGRAIWTKHLPDYPDEGMPSLKIKGYDLSNKMMDNTGPIIMGGKTAQLVVARPLDYADNQGQIFAQTHHSDVVAAIANMYGMDTDIDATTRVDDVVVKKGTKHFDLIKNLGNLNNRDFWVDFNPATHRWVLHWKANNRSQAGQYIFRYNQGDQSTLLSAAPEYGLRETTTTATILIFDDKNQRWVSAIEVQDAFGPDPIYRQGGGLAARSTAQALPKKKANADGTVSKRVTKAQAARHAAADVISDALDNASAFRIAAGGVSIEVLPPGNRFKTAEDAAIYLLRWFKARQDNFIVIQGSVIGVETMRARQVHTLRGLGDRLDGDYFFTRVRHKVGDEFYKCEFTANRVVNS